MLTLIALLAALNTSSGNCDPSITSPADLRAALKQHFTSDNEGLLLATYAANCSQKSKDPLAARYLVISEQAFMSVARSYRAQHNARMFWQFAAGAYQGSKYLLHDPTADAETKKEAQRILDEIRAGK